MTVRCSECRGDVLNPGVGVSRGTIEEDSFVEEGGFVACLSHLKDLPPRLRGLGQMGSGTVYQITTRTDSFGNEFLQFSGKDDLTIRGYASEEDAREYFPNTVERIMANSN